jgi:hypothetical protein
LSRQKEKKLIKINFRLHATVLCSSKWEKEIFVCQASEETSSEWGEAGKICEGVDNFSWVFIGVEVSISYSRAH